MATVPMTPYGRNKILEEIEKLKGTDRPEIVQAIAEARALGDLKENAEYHAARERQGFIEGRIEDLTSKLSNAQIIDITKMQNKGKVIFGSTVSIKNITNKTSRIVQIVGEEEAVESEDKISVTSPLSRGLVGKMLSETTTIVTPSQTYELLIEKIEYK